MALPHCQTKEAIQISADEDSSYEAETEILLDQELDL